MCCHPRSGVLGRAQTMSHGFFLLNNLRRWFFLFADCLRVMSHGFFSQQSAFFFVADPIKAVVDITYKLIAEESRRILLELDCQQFRLSFFQQLGIMHALQI